MEALSQTRNPHDTSEHALRWYVVYYTGLRGRGGDRGELEGVNLGQLCTLNLTWPLYIFLITVHSRDLHASLDSHWAVVLDLGNQTRG